MPDNLPQKARLALHQPSWQPPRPHNHAPPRIIPGQAEAGSAAHTTPRPPNRENKDKLNKTPTIPQQSPRKRKTSLGISLPLWFWPPKPLSSIKITASIQLTKLPTFFFLQFFFFALNDIQIKHGTGRILEISKLRDFSPSCPPLKPLPQISPASVL